MWKAWQGGCATGDCPRQYGHHHIQTDSSVILAAVMDHYSGVLCWDFYIEGSKTTNTGEVAAGYVYVCLCVCADVCVCVCAHVYVGVCARTHTRAREYTSVHASVHTPLKCLLRKQ